MIEIDTDLIKNMIQKNKRLDNRDFDKYREIVIEPGIVSSAEGSARVKIGETEVIAGVKMGIGEPYSDSPDSGVMSVNSEFVPLASPEFESGPPGEDSIELSRVVDRAIRESKAIDFKKLCITPEEKVWMVFIDIDIINDAGNLIDAAGIAAAVALANTKIPELDENQRPVYGKKTDESLPMNGIPISTTFVKIGSSILTDPNLAEMKSIDARLTVGTVNKDGKIMLCSMQKGGSIGMTPEDIGKIIDLSIQESEKIRAMIKS